MNKEVTINLAPVEKKEVLTFKDLYEDILNEIEIYKKLDMLDELMKQEVSIDFGDNKGNILLGFPTSFIGWLEGGGVHITGGLEKVLDWEKEKAKLIHGDI